MVGFQFMHAEVFAVGAGQARPAKRAARWCARTSESCRRLRWSVRLHGWPAARLMSEPVTPRTLYGLGADELEQWCADLVGTAGQQVDEKGRKQRKDTAILMGVVASYRGHPMKATPITCAGRP